jgi:hypothetical protein
MPEVVEQPQAIGAASFISTGRGTTPENLIEQLKNGVRALKMPVDNLVSNW